MGFVNYGVIFNVLLDGILLIALLKRILLDLICIGGVYVQFLLFSILT